MSVDTARTRVETLTQGSVAVYGRNARWRHGLVKRLAEAGHVHGEAANPAQIQQLLAQQRFDVLVLNVRDEGEASEIADVLRELRPPLHMVLLGSASALPLIAQPRRGGTLRYVPGVLDPRELCRLIDVAISSGTWDDGGAEHNGSALLEEVDLEEAVEGAAAAVYAQAKRKNQRFTNTITGPAPFALAHPLKLRKVLVDLLRLVVSSSPRGASITVDAHAAGDEWSIRIGSANGQPSSRAPGQLGEVLNDEVKMLASTARALHEQGGMLWVDVMGPSAMALSLTLPLPPEAATATA